MLNDITGENGNIIILLNNTEGNDMSEITDREQALSDAEQIKIDIDDAQDVENNKAYSILSYLGFLVLIPILLDRKSPYVKFHANQGLILLVAELIAAVISTVLWFIPVAGLVLSLVIGLPLYLATVVLMVIGIINAYGGKAKKLPILGEFELLK